uniref:Uncharacterized protein n=1 Tax=Oryzias latipes TaxID=8090 RepID=A0A3P9ISG4_ORYLA
MLRMPGHPGVQKTPALILAPTQVTRFMDSPALNLISRKSLENQKRNLIICQLSHYFVLERGINQSERTPQSRRKKGHTQTQTERHESVTHTHFPRSSVYAMCGPYRTFSTKFWTHSPFVGHTVLLLDTQSFCWTHSPFFVHTGRFNAKSGTHSPFVGHTVLSLDTQSFRWTHSPSFVHTGRFNAKFWTHSPFFGHTVLSLDTQSFFCPHRTFLTY